MKIAASLSLSSLGLASALWMALLPLTASGQTICTAFVALNATVSDDFTKVTLQPSCPSSSRKYPGQFHYHLTQVATTVEDGTPALALTASEADLLTPVVDAQGLTFDLNDAWTGEDSAVGAEMVFAAGKLQVLELEGKNEHTYVVDNHGSLATIDDISSDHRVHVTSASSGTLTYTHKGISGTVVIDAPGAAVELNLNGDQLDLSIVAARSVVGTITGAQNIVVVASGQLSTFQLSGLNNEVIINDAVTGGCENVNDNGQGNDCTDGSAQTVTLDDIACQGPPDWTYNCSGAMSWRNAIGWLWIMGAMAGVALL